MRVDELKLKKKTTSKSSCKMRCDRAKIALRDILVEVVQ